MTIHPIRRALLSTREQLVDALQIPFSEEQLDAITAPLEPGVIIAGAGGAAHLPGMLASKTAVPVLGVPVQSKALNGMDSLLSIVQMPAGIPVATFAIGVAGAANAALFAAALLAPQHPGIATALEAFRRRQTEEVSANDDPRLPVASPGPAAQ